MSGEYDYVIVGGGSAGCTLAARLAEDPSLKVCLVEAGTLYINGYFNAAIQSPVGGFRQSGYGRENGIEGMRCYRQTRSLWLATNPHQPDPFERIRYAWPRASCSGFGYPGSGKLRQKAGDW